MKLFLILVLILFSSHGFSQEESDVDQIALASILVKDGNYSRAERVLKKISSEDSRKALKESLWGMVELHKKNYKDSILRFNKSIELGIKSKEVYIYLSEAYLQIKDINKASASLEKVDKGSKEKLPYHLLKSEIYWQKNEKVLAWKILNQALKKKLSKNVIYKKKFKYFMKEKLYFSAYELAFEFFKNKGLWSDVLAMASQLRVNKQYEQSLKILQALSFVEPRNENIALEMTQNYLALGDNFSGALILEEAARVNNDLAFEASELLRQEGKSYRSKYLNFQTLDPKKRLKQKLSLYIEDDDYHSLKLMIPELKEHHLLEDEELRYAVAYSLFRTGDFKKSEEYLKLIARDDLFEKSLKLRDEISKCKIEKWACRETI